MNKDNSYLIVLSLDYKSDSCYAKVAAKVVNTDRHDRLHFNEFCKAFPKDSSAKSTDETAKSESMIVRGGYELVTGKDRAMLLFSDYLLGDIIDNITKNRRNSSINKDECQIIIDCSFGEDHVNETVRFYKDTIQLISGRTWMANYFGEPALITAGVNNKLKNHDPLLHCEKIISQAASFR